MTAPMSSDSRRSSIPRVNRDVVNVEVNRSRNALSPFPFDSVEGIIDDHQQDVQRPFVNLGVAPTSSARKTSSSAPRRRFSSGRSFPRWQSDRTRRALTDSAAFAFPGDSNSYIIAEDRSFPDEQAPKSITPHGCATVSSSRPVCWPQFYEWPRGLLLANQYEARPGPASNSNPQRQRCGRLCADGKSRPSDRLELRGGECVFDNHNAPLRRKISIRSARRAKFELFPRPGQQPSGSTTDGSSCRRNVEDLRAITSTAQGGRGCRTDIPRGGIIFFELGYVHRFPFGVVSKISAYRKEQHPRHRRCHRRRYGDRHIGEHRQGEHHRARRRVGNPSARSLLRVSELRDQSRLWESSDHRRVLPTGFVPGLLSTWTTISAVSGVASAVYSSRGF